MFLLSSGYREEQCEGKVSNIERFPIGRTRWGGELGGSRNGEEEGEIIMVLREAGVTVGDNCMTPHLPFHYVFDCRDDIRRAADIVQTLCRHCADPHCAEPSSLLSNPPSEAHVFFSTLFCNLPGLY